MHGRSALLLVLAMTSVVSRAAADEASGTHYSPIAPQIPAVKPAPIEESDHEETRLRPGIGYFGRFDAPIGIGRVEPAHLLGLRYWFRRRVGIDVAIGGNVALGSASSTSTRGPSLFVFAARVSLPIALVVTRHLTLFVAPTIGYAQAGESVPGEKGTSPITGLERTPPDARHGGLRLSFGGRIGAELQLGFVSAARLAILGSFGLDADYRRSWTTAPAAPTSSDPEPRAVESKQSRVSLRTTFAEDPWAAVLGNVAFLCYF